MSNALPVVSMPRHRAVRWTAADRADMARRLAPFGVSITELSDVRAACGLPRLSSTEPSVRWAAPHLLRGARGQAALAAVRAERALLTEALASLEPDLVYHARRLLGLRRATPSALRLVELQATFAQAMVLSITAEQREPARLAA